MFTLEDLQITNHDYVPFKAAIEIVWGKTVKLSCQIPTAVSHTAESFFPITTGGVTIRRR
ncbi:hypothetical protein YC2023_015432 [Brassica napus]